VWALYGYFVGQLIAAVMAKLLQQIGLRLRRSSKQDEKIDDEEFTLADCQVACEPTLLPRVVELAVNNGNDGLTLDVAGVGLIILEIGEGAVQDYNSSLELNELDLGVREMDIITSVNGERDVKKMLVTIQNGQSYKLTIVRPVQHVVVLEKDSGSLGGLNLKFSNGSRYLEILSLNEGVIQAYNMNSGPGARVLPGSLISSVNGESSSNLRMRNEIKKSKKLEISLLHVVLNRETRAPRDRQEFDFALDGFDIDDAAMGFDDSLVIEC